MGFTLLARGIRAQKRAMANARDSQLAGIADAERVNDSFYEPYKGVGKKSLASLNELIDDPSSIRKSVGYQFGLDEGKRQIEGSASARGGLLSGRTLLAMQERAQDYQDRFYGDEYARRASLAQFGYNIDQKQGDTKTDLAIARGQTNADYFANKSKYIAMHEQAGMNLFAQSLGNFMGMMGGKMGGGGGGGNVTGGGGGYNTSGVSMRDAGGSSGSLGYVPNYKLNYGSSY